MGLVRHLWLVAVVLVGLLPAMQAEAIFDGIARKETFGTSGPLIRLRFFGSWDYAKGLTEDKDFVKKAY